MLRNDVSPREINSRHVRTHGDAHAIAQSLTDTPAQRAAASPGEFFHANLSPFGALRAFLSFHRVTIACYISAGDILETSKNFAKSCSWLTATKFLSSSEDRSFISLPITIICISFSSLTEF